MHHLKHRSEGGPTTVENGANVAEVAHQYMHSLPREQEEVINDMLREWKNDFKLGVAEVTTEGVKQAQIIEFPEIAEDCIEIPVYDFTEKEYLEHKRKRNEKVFRKFEGYER